MPDHASKRCSRCSEVKPLDQFGRDRTAPGGLKCHCRECQRLENRRRYAANPESARESRRRSYAANRDAAREYSRRYYQDHREENAEANRDRVRAWARANPEAVREYDRQYYEANRAAVLKQQRQYRAERRATVLAHYGEQCACCATTEKLSIDHIGGGGDAHRKELFGNRSGGSKFDDWLIRNGFPPGYQTLCMPCNASKREGERCRLDHGG